MHLTLREVVHHYEEIGLLVPLRRTESGHRLYGGRDVARLQQILSLRQIGFSLDAPRSDRVGTARDGQRFRP